jgi:hypothetical protein
VIVVWFVGKRLGERDRECACGGVW